MIRLKKKHPCGSFLWNVQSTGADLRLQCQGCGRIVIRDRAQAWKDTRELIRGKSGDTGKEQETI